MVHLFSMKSYFSHECKSLNEILEFEWSMKLWILNGPSPQIGNCWLTSGIFMLLRVFFGALIVVIFVSHLQMSLTVNHVRNLRLVGYRTNKYIFLKSFFLIHISEIGSWILELILYSARSKIFNSEIHRRWWLYHSTKICPTNNRLSRDSTWQ